MEEKGERREWGKYAESVFCGPRSCLAPKLSGQLALIALPFVVKHCVGEIARYARGC